MCIARNWYVIVLTERNPRCGLLNAYCPAISIAILCYAKWRQFLCAEFRACTVDPPSRSNDKRTSILHWSDTRINEPIKEMLWWHRHHIHTLMKVQSCTPMHMDIGQTRERLYKRRANRMASMISRDFMIDERVIILQVRHNRLTPRDHARICGHNTLHGGDEFFRLHLLFITHCDCGQYLLAICADFWPANNTHIWRVHHSYIEYVEASDRTDCLLAYLLRLQPESIYVSYMALSTAVSDCFPVFDRAYFSHFHFIFFFFLLAYFTIYFFIFLSLSLSIFVWIYQLRGMPSPSTKHHTLITKGWAFFYLLVCVFVF